MKALHILKKEIALPRVLAHYGLNAESKISADASAHGLGAVLLKYQENHEWKPMRFASLIMLKILPIILSRISQKILLLFFCYSCIQPIIP